MIEDYGTLKAAIAQRINRTDRTNELPIYVRSAHDIIVGEVALSADLTLTTNTVAAPDDFRLALSLWLCSRPWVQVVEASSQQMQDAYAIGTGQPRLFRVDGSNLVLYPSPDGSYAAKLLYRIASAFFADDEATNAVLTKYPMVYFYGAVAEAMRDDYDDQRALQYEAMFRGEIARINRIESGEVLSGPLQMSSNG